MSEFYITEGDQRLGGHEVVLHSPNGAWAVGIKFGNGVVREFCKRCGGTGEYSFNLMDGTVCYGCMGKSLGESTTEADIVRRAINRHKAAAKRAEKAERAFQIKRAAMDAWQATHADLLAALEPHLSRVDSEGYTDFDWRPINTFLTDLADKAHRGVIPLSDRQVEAAKAALARQAQWDTEKAEKAAQSTAAGHYGKVGEKVTAEVVITGTKFFPGDWNRSNTTLVTMKTAEGHILKTFSSGEFGREAEAGQTVKIKGTVKTHGDYDGVPQTMLTRVSKLS